MKIEVGKTYKNRVGGVVNILKLNPLNLYPFTDESGERYISNGRLYATDTTPYDLIEEVKQSENKEIDMKPEVEDELRSTINNHRLSTDEAISLIIKATTQSPKLNPDDFYYPNAINWMWNYCIPLGKYETEGGIKFDLGVYESPTGEVSYAIVYSNNPGDYISGEIEVSNPLPSTYKETIRRYLNR